MFVQFMNGAPAFRFKFAFANAAAKLSAAIGARNEVSRYLESEKSWTICKFGNKKPRYKRGFEGIECNYQSTLLA